ARLLLRAMIAAARADGQVDAGERRAIAAQLDAAGLSAAERDAVLRDFDNPATPDELAREARDPMLAAQLYAAAVAAAGEISAGERAWLDRLATGLKLDQAARRAIESRLGG
ncbi:MAG: tellurite resistance TerB family protein, partial [Acetobacteraceae bacterium]|nr:tellurite resistance TerB family protein [Acetobacteraceae bacterium]